MKIAIISNLYPPLVRGGAEIVAAMQAEALKKNWQHVFVISSRPAHLKSKTGRLVSSDFFAVTQDEVNEVVVHRLRPFNLYYYLDDYRYPAPWRLLWHGLDIFNVFSYFFIKSILKKEQPDLVITHNLMGLGFLIPLLLRRLGLKHIHVLHDLQLITPSGLLIKGREKAWSHRFFRAVGYVRMMRKLWGSPAKILSPSKFLLDYYQRLGFFSASEKIVLPNPITNLLSINKIPSYNLEILYLGQVNQAKGVLELIKSFRQLKIAAARLHIVGVGQDLRRAKALAQGDKRIRFYGWLQRQALGPLLAKMDILILPSLCYENSPTVIYEALSMGLPVLTSDIGGAAELIREGYNGWTFPAGDFTALNNKLAMIYQQRDKLAPMAEQCRQSIQPYHIDHYVRKLLEIINDVK